MTVALPHPYLPDQFPEGSDARKLAEMVQQNFDALAIASGPTRFASGHVAADGTRTRGAGFGSTKTGTGTYTVTLDNPFVSTINATVSASNAGFAAAANTEDTDSFQVETTDSGGTHTDMAFSFTATPSTS